MPTTHDLRPPIIGINSDTAPPLDVLFCQRQCPGVDHRDSRAPWRLTVPAQSAAGKTARALQAFAAAGTHGAGKTLPIHHTDERR